MPPPIPFIEVCAAVICRRGKYFLAKRHPGKHMGGKWEFPGGKINDGESRRQCIRREIAEELGVTVNDPSFLTTTIHRYEEKTIRLHFMLCDLPAAARHVCCEHQDAGWFTADEIRKMDLAPADREFANGL